MEVEAVDGGRRPNEFSVYPLSVEEGIVGDLDDTAVGLRPVDDIQETFERATTLDRFLIHTKSAFSERRLTYPFSKSASGDSLVVLPGHQVLAKSCAALSSLTGIGNKSAKEFELRAVKALYSLIGGWAVSVGAPRRNQSGPKRAVEGFRELITNESGDYYCPNYPPSGDLGADAFWILGRSWGGPIIYFQAKNAPFSIRDLPPEFLRISDILYDWFGKRIDCYRVVVPVYAVNTVFTTELKEKAFQSSGSNRGLHIIDAVDVLHAEQSRQEFFKYHSKLKIM